MVDTSSSTVEQAAFEPRNVPHRFRPGKRREHHWHFPSGEPLLIARLGESGIFANVWRQGDKRIDANVIVLNIGVQPRSRQNVELTDHTQNVLLKKQVSAAIRFHGENMEAGHSLCKKVRKATQDVAHPSDSKAVGYPRVDKRFQFRS